MSRREGTEIEVERTGKFTLADERIATLDKGRAARNVVAKQLRETLRIGCTARPS
jgi:hypothetical protein